ncbi:hypothetical protein SCHPADRAFT_942352 [Schizopora paradoxa]|uniref:J domain-containing protein n=1 Tax=Schizopora paradoxa TaxID=27342 RepID=A0A0H2S269_9AGAM|nr:hypothetical protein SCHPADRAFT_942352 [Schizopora paradoxa]
MLSSTASALLGVAGWSYIPDFATRHCLNFFHHILRSRGHPIPQPGSRAWIQHYRYTFAAVVLGYLVYNLVEASRTAPANFFQIVGVSPNADETTLTKAFRAFARVNHPDRVGKQGEELFMQVRTAYESLKDPTTRFAYERFGPDVLNWRDCKTAKEYLKKGLLQGLGFYISSAIILLLMSSFMKASAVAFWRYVLLFALLASELTLLVGYDTVHFLNVLFPYRVAFQHVLFLHQLFMFFSIALSRVFPVLFPESGGIDPMDERTYKPFLDRLAMLAQTADREVSRMLHTELHSMQGSKSTSSFSNITPCQPTDVDMDELSREMENMIVEHQLRLEAPIRPVWDAAVQRGRESFVAMQQRAQRRPPPLRQGSRSPVKGGLPSPPGGSVSPEIPFKELVPNGHAPEPLDSSEQSKMPSPVPSRPPSRTQSPSRPASSL